MNQIENPQKNRISSIDALRAFALFGIILVHAIGGFCIDTTNALNTPLDVFLVDSITLLLKGNILVFFLSDLGFGFKYQSITFYVCAALVFYVIQLLFSYHWLKKYKNGPLEYLWRCATERKWLPLLLSK